MEQSGMLKQIENFLLPVCKAVASLGWVSMLLMTGITAFDVIGRNFFAAPLSGSIEVVSVCLMLALMGGMPYAELRDEHIRVDILMEKFPLSVQRAMSVAMGWLYFLLAVILAWQCLEQGIFLKAQNSNSGIMAIPLWPFVYAMAILLMLFCVAIFLNLMKRWTLFWENKDKSYIVLALFVCFGSYLIWLSLFPDTAPYFFDDAATGLLSLGLLFGSIFCGLPIGAAMVLACLCGMTHLMSAESGLALLGMVSKTVASNYSWSVAPLFIFMGVLVSACQFSQDIFDTAYKWLGHLKGGLASATVGACSIFAAVVGDSLSGVVTMGSIAIPQMKKYKYDMKLSTGCVAVGGSLGILIPPSMGFIVYGLMTEQSIGKLFMAGLIPGILVTAMLIAMITFRCHRNPALGPAGEKATMAERLKVTLKSWHVLSLFAIVLGGIWLGWFTPTEAGAIGLFSVLVIGGCLRRLPLKGVAVSGLDAARMISSIFFIFIYATAFTQYIAVTQLPALLSEFVVSLPIGRYGVLIVIMLIYLLLGCIMNALPVIILTLPILYPTVLGLGFDPIWFGVIVVILAELGQITPPIGMSVFALRNIAPEVPLFTMFAGTVPFWGVFILLIALLTIFPQIALFLPELLY